MMPLQIQTIGSFKCIITGKKKNTTKQNNLPHQSHSDVCVNTCVNVCAGKCVHVYVCRCVCVSHTHLSNTVNNSDFISYLASITPVR